MNDPILQRWTYRSPEGCVKQIIPDGCSDVICWRSPGREPVWTISPLQDSTMTVVIPGGMQLVGYRVMPGAVIGEDDIRRVLRTRIDDADLVATIIQEHLRLDHRVTEALAALARSGGVGECAQDLGVSLRTLERLVRRHTQRAPVFWLQLARVRASARRLADGEAAGEVAAELGYADQSHLVRSVRRWIGVTPSQLGRRRDLIEQLRAPGYD